jgi:hypothetical protein
LIIVGYLSPNRSGDTATWNKFLKIWEWNGWGVLHLGSCIPFLLRYGLLLFDLGCWWRRRLSLGGRLLLRVRLREGDVGLYRDCRDNRLSPSWIGIGMIELDGNENVRRDSERIEC